jgi:hypothetical protein
MPAPSTAGLPWQLGTPRKSLPPSRPDPPGGLWTLAELSRAESKRTSEHLLIGHDSICLPYIAHGGTSMSFRRIIMLGRSSRADGRGDAAQEFISDHQIMIIMRAWRDRVPSIDPRPSPRGPIFILAWPGWIAPEPSTGAVPTNQGPLSSQPDVTAQARAAPLEPTGRTTPFERALPRAA